MPRDANLSDDCRNFLIKENNKGNILFNKGNILFNKGNILFNKGDILFNKVIIKFVRS